MNPHAHLVSGPTYGRATCQAALQDRRAAQHIDPKGLRGFDRGERLTINLLVLLGQGLWHGQIVGQLDYAEMVSSIPNVMGCRYQLSQC